ncbi:MAG: hypothetical protein GC179_24970 [Anaerolineaceae bacterium]|nr:hypothetical protein [Anaerolineaceae bacterium]
MRRSMSLIRFFTLVVLLSLTTACNAMMVLGMLPSKSALTPTPIPSPIPLSSQATADCPVSKPTGPMSSDKAIKDLDFSNPENTLLTILWPESTVIFERGGAGEMSADGSLSMKWPWYRHNIKGQVVIEGRRLDADAPPLKAIVGCCYGNQTAAPDCCYGDTGFTPSALIFSSEGCWEVTGKVNEHRLTFVTLVVRRD